MLLPEQVVPFLQHDDPEVRSHASNYLAKAHDPSPATADDFWRSIDRFGIEKSIPLIADMADVPSTEQSCTRMLQALRDSVGDDADYHLQQAISRVDLPILLARRDDLLAEPQLLPRVREHLRQRIELSDRPLDQLWQALTGHSDEVEGKHWGEFHFDTSDRLIEACARQGEPAARLALDRLERGPRDDWMEIFCVQLLGQLRYVPATGALIERLIIPDADLLNQESVRALSRVGTVEVVERLEAIYPSQEWGVRLFVDDPLAGIKRPESERALLRMLGAESDEELQTFLALGLAELCTTEGLEAIRRMVIGEAYAPGVAELDEMLVTVATMTGYEFPEAGALRERVAQRRRERDKWRAEWRDAPSAARQVRERWRRGEPSWPSTSEDAGGAPPGASAWAEGYGAERGGTYRRDEPKVGRNDLCPCGSGKKYKKCCLSAASPGRR